MTTTEKGRSLPKFGEWDVNNPASAEGFTVIFAKARDDKQSKPQAAINSQQNQPNQEAAIQTASLKKWWCCF